MQSKLPTVTIDPRDVIDHFRSVQKVSVKDSELWLWVNKRKIESLMREVLEERMDYILVETSSDGYPNPLFDATYRILKLTIANAAEEYAESLGLEFRSSSYSEPELRDVIRDLVNDENVDVMIDYELRFFSPSENDEAEDETPAAETPSIRIFGTTQELSVQIIREAA